VLHGSARVVWQAFRWQVRWQASGRFPRDHDVAGRLGRRRPHPAKASIASWTTSAARKTGSHRVFRTRATPTSRDDTSRVSPRALRKPASPTSGVRGGPERVRRRERRRLGGRNPRRKRSWRLHR
jgi:hypothetical protein